MPSPSRAHPRRCADSVPLHRPTTSCPGATPTQPACALCARQQAPACPACHHHGQQRRHHHIDTDRSRPRPAMAPPSRLRPLGLPSRLTVAAEPVQLPDSGRRSRWTRHDGCTPARPSRTAVPCPHGCSCLHWLPCGRPTIDGTLTGFRWKTSSPPCPTLPPMAPCTLKSACRVRFRTWWANNPRVDLAGGQWWSGAHQQRRQRFGDSHLSRGCRDQSLSCWCSRLRIPRT